MVAAKSLVNSKAKHDDSFKELQVYLRLHEWIVVGIRHSITDKILYFARGLDDT